MSKKAKDTPTTPEWDFQVDVSELDKKPLRVHMEADAGARGSLARRLGLVKLEALAADLTLAQEPGSALVRVTGDLRADVVQSCVVTGEKIHSTVTDRFEAWYADPEKAVSFARERHRREARKTHAELPMLEEHDDPEPIKEDKIDAGELVTQFLSLALNPFPQIEGAEKVLEALGEKEAEKPAGRGLFPNPFEALKDWKKGRE